MLLLLLLAACALLRPVLAVFVDEAWNVDYHYALLGEPKEETTFFHQPNPNSRASLLYTLSEQGALGAVNPRDGALVWRQLLADGVVPANTSHLRAGEGQDIVVSGVGNTVAAWSAADGRQAWSLELAGSVKDLEILELSDGRDAPSAKDAIVLSGGVTQHITRVDGASGAVKWQTALDSTDAVYQVSASNTEIFAILLHRTMLGYVKIRVLSFDPVTGQKTDEYSLSSDNELSSADTIVAVGANSASPIIAWTDAALSVLKVNVIGNKEISSFSIDRHGDQAVTRVRLRAPFHVNSLAHFLVHYETSTSHWAEVFHIDLTKAKIVKAYSLPNVQGKGTFSTTTSDANVYFTRTTRDEVLTVSSASHGVLGRWPINGYGVAADVGEVVEPMHAASEVSVKGDTVSAIRTAALTSTGAWVLLRGGSAVWERPEELASTVSAAFATTAEVEALAQDLAVEAHSNPLAAYIHRLRRHIQDLRLLPAALSSMPQRLISGFSGTSAEADSSSNIFGFHKIIVCATANGRLVALDVAKPDRILWNKQIAGTIVSPAKWTPTVRAETDGVVSLSTDATTGLRRYQANTGQEVPGETTSTVLEAGSTSAKAITYTMKSGELSASIDSASAWHFVSAGDQRIVSLVPRPVNDPVASIGKVLGDRRVLYKYLSPNTALLVTASDTKQSATFSVLDTVTGGILHSSLHSGVDLSAPIASIMSENWFAYSFTSEALGPSPKGHHLVVGEMFESLVPNDRGLLRAAPNTSSLHTTPDPFTLLHTYQIPEPISKLSVTQTRQGITSRQILAVLPASKALIGIPYGVVDPRRPVNRDPTKDEQAEGLLRYQPVLTFDPKWHLNHQREVFGVTGLVTSPALIESTSLVFAYGLDIFGTRLSPSFSFDILGKDFNKVQMLATVAALAVATFVVAPLVARKQVDTRWQFT